MTSPTITPKPAIRVRRVVVPDARLFVQSLPILLALTLTGCTISSRGVEPSLQKHEPVHVQGTISRIERLPPPEQQLQQNAVITLTTSGKLIRVELAPGWYLDEQGLRFREEQKLVVTGALHEDDVLIATEVEHEGKTIRLRDEEGKPLWAPRPESHEEPDGE